MMLWLAVGLPASGKSRWAEELVKSSPETTARVNMDLLRMMLHASWWTPIDICNLRVITMRNVVTEGLMKAGTPTIVNDDTNLHPEGVDEMQKLADRHGYLLKIRDFRLVPVEECIRRDARRERQVGAAVIRGMYERYRDQFP